MVNICGGSWGTIGGMDCWAPAAAAAASGGGAPPPPGGGGGSLRVRFSIVGTDGGRD